MVNCLLASLLLLLTLRFWGGTPAKEVSLSSVPLIPPQRVPIPLGLQGNPVERQERLPSSKEPPPPGSVSRACSVAGSLASPLALPLLQGGFNFSRHSRVLHVL